MGFILESEDDIHGESRRESFVIYTDYGEDRIELEWDKLDAMIRMAQKLKARHEKQVSAPAPRYMMPHNRRDSE